MNLEEACGDCGAKKKERKKCTGCYHIWYCNRECQLQHWEQHKDDCKKILAEYKECKFETKTIYNFASIHGKTGIFDSASRPKKSHFVVKIQVPIPLDFFGFTLKDLAIYNKDRSFYITLSKEGNENVYEELSERIKSEGVDGLKGYFHAILEKKKGKEILKINTQRMGSVDAW